MVSALSRFKCWIQRRPDVSQQGVARGQWLLHWQALQRSRETSGRCPVGELVSAHGLRCISWKGTNHYLRDTPCHEH